LDSDKYDSVDIFQADIDLMVRNAITFNGPDSEVGQYAAAVRDRVSELMMTGKSNGKKRKDGEKSTPQPMKKAKLG
jgi:transcription initiation factor TFIID subunit 2